MEKSAIADPLVGRLLDGRYRIEAKIARGGMATVYEATDLRLDRRVALKVMPHALADDNEFAQRFVREARAAARLTHPNVVAVYDQGDDNGVLFLTMEYVEGRHTLRDVIRDEAPLAPARALAILEEILRALSAAHESGIIHRDIKPENVLISPRGQVKVADFGLARAISTSTNATATGGVLMGTVSYLPPELVVDGTADARSDVYSVGVLLFELLTGTKPHVGDSPIQVAYKHVHEDVPHPSSLVSAIPPYLDAFVARATARQRDLRPADAHVMLQQLRRVRHAVDHGVTDDQDLTDDLTPTLAAAVPRPDAHDNPEPSHGYAARLVPPDEVFDQDAFGSEARTMIVGSAASRGEVTLEEPAGVTSQAPGYAPPGWPPGYSTSPAYAGPPGTPRSPSPAAPARRRRRKGGWIALIIVVALAAGAAFGGWYYSIGRFQTTPDVVGMSQSAAAAKLQQSGLSLDVTAAAYSERIPDGDLISTTPKSGQDVRKGGTVKAVISRGPERHDVPDLKGMTESEAIGLLKERFLAVADPVRREWSATVASGTLISFSPKAGTPLKRDAPVSLIVSKGPQPILIPSWVSRDATDATTALEKLGFVVDPTSAYNDDVPSGQVVNQTPRSGTGFWGDHVSIVISRGPHLVKVPNLFRMSTSDAENALREAGFVPNAQNYTPHFGFDQVVTQSPKADDMAPFGSVVTFYVI